MKIGLTFIFGNVEDYMPRFLESFRKLTPHLYGVRAIGAQPADSSWRICEAKGVKLAEYKNQPDAASWEHLDDFGTARNMAADMAAADGCDWILWADTDDVLEDQDRERILELLAQRSEGVDFWLLAYALTNNGLRLPRERAWRPGKARWIDPIHENADPAEGAQVVQCMDIAITHKPDTGIKKSPPDRNLKIIETRIPRPLQGKWAFYRAQELIGLGRKKEAVEAAIEAVKLPDLTSAEKYELLLNLSGLTDRMDIRAEYLAAAHKVDPTRREALACLAAVCLDTGHADHALAYSRCFMALPEPKQKQWTHRGMLYGWAGNLIHYQCLRMNGLTAEADRLEREHFEKHGGLISLVHATRARPYEAAATRKLWLERAKNPDAIEHIFAIGADDIESLAVLRRFRHVIAKDSREATAAATCFNAGAADSHGRILVACADGMIPPVWWDETLLQAVPAGGATSLKAVLKNQINGNGPVMARPAFKKAGHLIVPAPAQGGSSGYKITVCHATRGRPEKAIGCRQLWMAKAHDPWSVEWIFSVDDDDATAGKLKAFKPIKGPGGCVAAWNRAAEAARGEVLIQGSDDWDPPQDWDKIILERLGDTSRPAVLAVSDGYRKDDLLCMAILTRARWEQQGRVMFAPEYDAASGIFSDNEYSLRAARDGVIVPARDVVFRHENPLFTGAEQDDEFRRHNARENYEKGEAIFSLRNPPA